MRFATIKGACGVVEFVVEGEPMAVGMRAATIKKGVRRGGARGLGRVHGGRHARRYHQKGRAAWRSSRSRASPWRSTCAPLQSKERAARWSLVKDEDELPLMQILAKLSQ